MMRFWQALPALGLGIASVLLGRTWRFGEPQTPPLPPPSRFPIAFDAEAAGRRLADLLRHPTVSWPRAEKFDRPAFQALHATLEQHYPRCHAVLQREEIEGLSLLYTWPGSDPDLNPILLMAHQDVVPVTAETENSWTHPPFAGVIADGFIWGRGALDAKSSLAALMEAAELLIAEEFRPRRTIYLAFGHDEEVGGTGNRQIARLLQDRGVRLAFVLDEGETLTEGIVPGVADPVALVGIAEKGYVSLEIRAQGEGGHSSMPPPVTAVGRLARAVGRLEKSPFPADLTFVAQLFNSLGDRLPIPLRLVFANLWLFSPLVKFRLSRSPELNAGIRTTHAVTGLRAGERENVLPQSATAVINLRLLPGDTLAEVIEQINRIIGDPHVQVQALPVRSDPSPVSDCRSRSYQLLAQTIRQVEPRAAVAPFIVVGATDSRHFMPLAENIYRFLFLPLRADDLQRIHGTDERLAVIDFARMVSFYCRLLLNAQEI